MSEKRAKKRSLADELLTYGERSLYGLRQGAEEFGTLARELMAKVPPSVVNGAASVMESAPGAGVLESMRLGREAGDLYRQGRYLDSLDRFADAVDAPFDDVIWFLPGAGIVPKVMK